MSDPVKPPAPITFVRPDPQPFVLLYAKVRGNGIVLGTENFKPTGTEWAQPEDMRDAGYVLLKDARMAVLTLASKLRVKQTDEAVVAALQVLGLTE